MRGNDRILRAVEQETKTASEHQYNDSILIFNPIIIIHYNDVKYHSDRTYGYIPKEQLRVQKRYGFAQAAKDDLIQLATGVKNLPQRVLGDLQG